MKMVQLIVDGKGGGATKGTKMRIKSRAIKKSLEKQQQHDITLKYYIICQMGSSSSE